jgi:hypothetical protein
MEIFDFSTSELYVYFSVANSVTRFGDCLHWADFFKICTSGPYVWATLFRGKKDVFILKILKCVWLENGHIFTKTHLVTLVAKAGAKNC